MNKHISLAQNENKDKVIKIVFDYDLDMIMKIRDIPGRKYYSNPSCWSIPFSIEGIEQLIGYGFTANESLLSAVNEQKQKKVAIATKGISGLKGKLMPFQNEGVAFIEDKKGRVLLADEQGLGKTIQSIAWIELHRHKIPIVVICPASLKLNWKKEIEAWLNDTDIEILSGTTPYKTKSNILILNYDIAYAWELEIKKRNPKILILDEVQAIKSNKAIRTKAVKKITRGVEHILCLSGTPIMNRPIEIYNALKIIDPELFPNFVAFTLKYCKAHHNGFGMDYSGASNTQELHSILTKTVMIRRLKQDVLKELPDKIYSFIPMELENEKEYRKAENDFIEYVRLVKGKEAAERIQNIEALAKIEGLKQLAATGKMKYIIDWIRNFLESDNKLVVFANHKFVIEMLMTEFKNDAVKIDGSVSIYQRHANVGKFQNDKNVKLFVGNIQAAGTGITLTASSNVAFIETGWSPAAHHQAEDRCHRIGQKDSVNVYYLIANGTIEEKIMKLLDVKSNVVNSVLDGKDITETNVFHNLLNEYVK